MAVHLRRFGSLATNLKKLGDAVASKLRWGEQIYGEVKSSGNFTWKYVPVSLDPESDDFLKDFQCFLQPHVPSSHVSSDSGNTRLVTFREGMSNKLVGVFDEDKVLKEGALVRVYGPDLVDRDDEIVALQVMQNTCGSAAASVYCQFENGLCYSFQSGRNLTLDEMGDAHYMRRVAECLAKMHSLDIPDAFKFKAPSLWGCCEEWLHGILRNRRELENAKFKEAFGSVDLLSEEYKRLKRELVFLCCSPMVLSHNDVSHLNLVYCKDKDRVSLIDFEFSGVNYSAFDIGQFFTKTPGLNSSYRCEERQKHFIKMYLEECAKIKEREYKPSAGEIHFVYREANKFALSSYFMWSLWSVLQSLYSPLYYDYIEHGGMKFAEFQERKEELYAC